MGQEPTLFAGSVEDNVKRGRNEAVITDNLIPAFDEYLSSHDSSCIGGNSSVTQSHTEMSYQKVVQGQEAPTGPDDIEMGTPKGGPDADVLHACQLSHADEFIGSFPNGYATDVAEGSVNISGGQKQRIAIARALVKQPKILLLDEATSALDTASEKLVQKSIDDLREAGAYTTLVIAHRLSTIRNADRIAVIEKGEVVEIGSHERLLETGGVYAQLWRKQNGKKQDSAQLDNGREESLKVLGRN